SLLWREVLERRDDSEPNVVTKERSRFRVAGRGRDVVEGDRVDQLGECPRAALAAEMIEAHRGRDPEEPTLDRSAVMEVVGTLDGARDGLLTQVVGVRPCPGHAIAVPPEALAAPLDGGEDDRGAAQRHGSRERGRLGHLDGYGRPPTPWSIGTTTQRPHTPRRPEVFLTT